MRANGSATSARPTQRSADQPGRRSQTGAKPAIQLSAKAAALYSYHVRCISFAAQGLHEGATVARAEERVPGDERRRAGFPAARARLRVHAAVDLERGLAS